MQTRSPLLGGLVLGIAILVATFAGAEEPVRIAQAAGSAEGAGQPPPSRPPRPQKAPPDSNIEEIVVLGAESDASSDFNAGDSVTGFGAEDLAALGAQSVADLASFTPNLEIVTGGATTPTFFIRGVGLNDFNSNSTGAVAVYRDDVAINAPALQLNTLFDVEAVNILKGPQGIGLNRNASAGAIKIYSRKPTGDFGGYLRSDLGDYDYHDFEGAFEAPIYEDLLSGRFAFRLTQRDGTMENRCGGAPIARVPFMGGSGGQTYDRPFSICGEQVTGGMDNPGFSDVPPGLDRFVNNRNNWAARGTFLFQPTLDQTWLINGHGSRRDELSRLGQSYGTFGFYCVNGDICSGTALDPSQQGIRINGLLGGRQGIAGAGYQAPEVTRRLEELAPCLTGPNGCFSGTPGPDLDRRKVEINRAKVQVARELARNLDSLPWEGDFNRTGPTTNDTYGSYVKGDIALPGAVSLTTTSGFDGYDRKIDIDLDFSPETLFQILTEDTGWQVYQDVRLQGDIGKTNPVSWDIGGWMLREHLRVSVDNDLGTQQAVGVAGRDYDQDSWSTGGYASFSFDFWNDFTLDGGVRYNWDQKDLDYALLPGNGEAPELTRLHRIWQAPTGMLRLTYRFREDTHAYWKYTRGWKPGTYNATSGQNRPITVPDPEQIDSFELGMRGNWFDGRVDLDGALFYYSYSNYQIFTTQQFLGGNTEFVILNASDAEVYGAELDGSARPWPGAFVNLRFSWLESQFLDFVQVNSQLSGDGVVFQEVQNSGNQLLNSPRFKISITAEQTIPLGRYGALVPRYDGVWTDDTFYDATQGRGDPDIEGNLVLPKLTIAQRAYWLHNVRLGWRSPDGRLEIAAWCRNVANKAYKTYAFDASEFRKTSIYFVGDPRTIGGTIIFNF